MSQSVESVLLMIAAVHKELVYSFSALDSNCSFHIVCHHGRSFKCSGIWLHIQEEEFENPAAHTEDTLAGKSVSWKYYAKNLHPLCVYKVF